MTVKRIVCLANSRKLRQRCIAGKEIEGGGQGIWIRPVSLRESGELTFSDRRYANGKDPQVMDVMDVRLGHAQPKGCQQENWVLAGPGSITKVRRASWSELDTLVDPEGPLWVDGHHTGSGLNDEVPFDVADTLTSSLRLLRVGSLTVSVFTHWNRKRVQGRFVYVGVQYRLWITDPVYEQRYKAEPEGDFDVGESYLTVSVGEPFGKTNACYKLIAAIIERPGGERR